MIAIRTGTLLAVVAIGLSMAGCIVENEHSIIDTPAPPDARLVGVWALEAGGNAQVLRLQKREEDGNSLLATFILIADNDPPAAVSRATVNFTAVGGRPYFEASWKTGEWLPLDPPVRRSFGTYELRGGPDAAADTLKVCFADAEEFEAPLKNGSLSGYSGTGQGYERRVVLASKGPVVRSFLAKNHLKCSVTSLFRRVSGPPQQK